jgi:hypothetical protein
MMMSAQDSHQLQKKDLICHPAKTYLSNNDICVLHSNLLYLQYVILDGTFLPPNDPREQKKEEEENLQYDK